MTNRKTTSPIRSALVLSLLVGCPLISRGQAVAPTAAAPAPAMQPVAPAAPKHTAPYTVVAGDSLTSIAKKFNTTRKNLRALNHLSDTVTKVAPGQILLVPSLKSAKTATAAAQAKARHDYAMAQPVQDFDVPASTFASCPVPLPTPEDDPSTPAPDEKPAPIAKLVSPSEMSAEPPVEIVPTTPIPPVAETPVKPVAPPKPKFVANAAPVAPTAPVPTGRAFPVTPNLPAPHPSRSLAELFGFGTPPPATDWGSRFLVQARALGNKGIDYDDDWRPAGRSARMGDGLLQHRALSL